MSWSSTGASDTLPGEDADGSAELGHVLVGDGSVRHVIPLLVSATSPVHRGSHVPPGLIRPQREQAARPPSAAYPAACRPFASS